MKIVLYSFLLGFILSCSTSNEKPRPDDWQGVWNAQWKTPPESYPGIENMDFIMNGVFTITGDSLTIQANGYDGCIFYSDTLEHTQSWYVSRDIDEQDSALVLINDPDLVGMTYKVNAKSVNKIELQLLEDIFITLTR